MVDQPNLEVLQLRPRPPLELTPRTQSLLELLAAELHLPPDLALQQAVTHTLSCLQRKQSIYLTLPFEAPPDHKPGPDHG